MSKIKAILSACWRKKRIRYSILLTLLAILSWIFFGMDKGLTAQQFVMTRIERGDIIETVTASGKIQPINTVSVGTQISGIVETVLADYNDEVKEGQLLAQLDTALLTETQNDAQARLDLANARKKVAQLNYNRYQKLYKDKLMCIPDP